MKTRMKIKQSELNCRVLMKQFGEMRDKVQDLERQLAWEKRKTEILEEMLRRSQQSIPPTTNSPVEKEDAAMEEGANECQDAQSQRSQAQTPISVD